MIGANEKRLKRLQKELAKEYKAAEKELLAKAEKYMKAFKQADAIEAARLAKGEITQAQYDAWRAAKLQRSEWARRMSSELAKDLTNEDVKAIARVNGITTEAATEGSMYANFEASRITGKSYTLISRSALEEAMSGSLYKKKVNIPKDMQWNEKHVRSAITQSLLQGESVPATAKRLRQVAEMNRAASLRDARTMINAAEQGGKLAEYEELAEEGVNIEKGWMATHDERTRDSHAEMDMEYVPVDEPFSNGLMEPCDPDGDPAEVYNCRCTLVSRIDGVSISQEERRDNLDRPYEEWKNRNKVEQAMPESLDPNMQAESMLKRAYEEHSESNGLNRVPAEDVNTEWANYKNVSDETATVFNNTVEGLVNEYDTPLDKIRTMSRQEAAESMGSFARTIHNYETGEATLLINPVKCKDYNSLTDRIRQLADNGYAVAISKGNEGKYLATHEFGHTLLSFNDKLINKRNWVGENYTRIRNARKEAEPLWERYIKTIGDLERQRKSAEFDYMMGNANRGEEARKLADQIKKIKISEYSMTNIDEFFAEGFTDAKIGAGKNEYSKEIMKIINKYFRK